MIIDIQKEQMHFEAGDVLRIKDNGIISTIFEAHSVGTTQGRCERCDFADSKAECSLGAFCCDTRFLSVFYLQQ